MSDTAEQEAESGSASEENSTDDRREAAKRQGTPGSGVTPDANRVEPGAPEEFGLVQVWWGDGKGKTTAALGMGARAAGHGYRVHMVQFMKGGADSVEDVRGEYNAIAALPGFTYENTGHYGWHGMRDGSAENDHAAKAQGGLERTRDLIAAANEAALTTPFPLDADADAGMHLLILDEILYAVDKGLVDEDAVLDLIADKPDDLELVLTGSHTKPEFVYDHADLVTEVGKEKHPIDEGQRARKGTEF